MIVVSSSTKSPYVRLVAAPPSRGLYAVKVAVAVEHQHPFRPLRRSVRFLENRAQSDIVKRDREFMLFGEVLYLLLALAQAHVPRPDPRELRIINGANLLFLQFRFNQVGKLTHEGIASFSVHLFHLKSNPVHI